MGMKEDTVKNRNPWLKSCLGGSRIGGDEEPSEQDCGFAK